VGTSEFGAAKCLDNCEKIYGIDSSELFLAIPMWERSGNKIYDYSRNNNNGDITTALWNTYGLRFNGSSDYIAVPDADELTLINAFSIITTINRDDTSRGVIIDKGGSSGNREYRIEAFNSTQLYILIGSNGGDWGFTWLANATVLPGNMTNICVTWDNSGSGPVLVYLDGNEENNDTYTGNTTNGIANLLIGANNNNLDNPENFFDGIINNIVIFKKAINAAQVSLFNDRPYGLFEQVKCPSYHFVKLPPGFPRIVQWYLEEEARTWL